MKVEVELPEVDGDGDAATVSFWYVEEDEDVEEGDDLVEMITERATFNIKAPASGSVVEIHVQEGDVVKVGDILALLETEDDDEYDEYDDDVNEDEDD